MASAAACRRSGFLWHLRERKVAGSTTNPPSPKSGGIRPSAYCRNRRHRHQLHERHHVASEGSDDHSPQCLDESVGTLVHHPMSSADRYLWTLPMFHANGWTFVWTVTAVGATHLCLTHVNPSSIYSTIIGEAATVLCAAPTILIGIANGSAAERRQLPQGVRVLTAGAPPAAATIERIEGELGWTILQVYGLTETSPFITACEVRPEHAALDGRDKAVVKAQQGVELITSGETEVVDENGKPVPQDGKTLGEIVARGNVVMKGYYNDPEATNSAFRGGWFHTGDAAVVHPGGYIEIRDRYKDVIISGGENISSIEVEGVLLRHPSVLEVAVVGVADEKWERRPMHSSFCGWAKMPVQKNFESLPGPISRTLRYQAPTTSFESCQNGDRQNSKIRAEAAT